MLLHHNHSIINLPIRYHVPDIRTGIYSQLSVTKEQNISKKRSFPAGKKPRLFFDRTHFTEENKHLGEPRKKI